MSDFSDVLEKTPCSILVADVRGFHISSSQLAQSALGLQGIEGPTAYIH